MDRCVIWGVGADYEKIINQIKYEELKGNLKIIALVSKKDEIFNSSRDGYRMITRNDLIDREFDTVIISSSKYYEEIISELNGLGIKEKYIINGKIFELPLFDYNRYIKLIKNPVTILSDDCWGGYIYHKLFLKFTSPLINTLWERRDYCKFIQNPLYYFSFPLQMLRDADLRENIYPVGELGKGEDKIRIKFIHSRSFQEAAELWEKRKERINKERIFVKLGFDVYEPHGREWLRIFDGVPFPKICFYSGNTNIKNIVYLKRFEWFCHQGSRMDSYSYNDYCRSMTQLFKDIDILKLLNGEEDYVREK